MGIQKSCMEGVVMSRLLNDFYKGKRVFVTGHTGFKGAWLSLWLKDLGAEVAGYSLNPPTETSLFEAIGLENDIIHTIGDIRDYDSLLVAMKSFQPEIVFHLAAQPLVRLSYDEPRMTYETNVIGSLNVYEAIRCIDTVRSVVSITTDKCYENKEWVYGYRETDAMGGYDPYSSSKGCAELLSSSYRNSYFNNADYGKIHNVAMATARAGNVIGGGDWAKDRLIPDCINYLFDNKEIEIRSPHSVRPWQHVLEPLSGYLLLGEKLYHNGPDYAEGWNFGPDDSGVLTVEEVVSEVIENWGSGKMITDKKPQPHEAKLLKLDISKAIFKLKWKPAFTPVEAIQKTVSWYSYFLNNNLSVNEVKDFTLNQIKEYENKIGL